MTQRQALKYIGVYLWKRERLGFLFTFIFAIYLGSINSASINGSLGDEEIPKVLNALMDWLYLTMFPIFGLAMNKSILAMWRDDHYSKRLAQLRTMPIPLASIVQARFLQTAFTMPVIGTVFIITQYLLSPNLRDAVSPMQLLVVDIIWIAYSLIINALYIWFELGFKGKRYVQFYLGFMLFMAIICAILTLQGVYLVHEVLWIVLEGYSAVAIALLVIVAIVVIWMCYRATISRVRTRSMTF
ncbi:hypothetical protein [Cohnella abietis]|uniref:ABC transporter permease n=1 Tax=Cohnella abietis TaxID=2507935 RepID=A0A3T1D090_9BACL|nr:hypothetical protein [Cohnella abietis]BBI31512.1 hypothetical protein KCTCHS21_09110 [Cohnella abietis]